MNKKRFLNVIMKLAGIEEIGIDKPITLIPEKKTHEWAYKNIPPDAYLLNWESEIQ